MLGFKEGFGWRRGAFEFGGQCLFNGQGAYSSLGLCLYRQVILHVDFDAILSIILEDKSMQVFFELVKM